jgi:hypothetical protein
MLDSLEEAILLVEQSYNSGDELNLEPVVDFIVGQQIRFGTNSGIFVESRNVSRSKARVYTGEKLQTGLAAKNILTIESARALVLSGSKLETVQESIALADTWLENQCFSDFCATGECRYSSIAFIRYLNALGNSPRLESMITKLSEFRDAKGGWTGFPYFFTLLALTEVDVPTAEDELRYALIYTEKRFKRSRIEEPYISRRNEIHANLLNRFEQSLLNHL